MDAVLTDGLAVRDDASDDVGSKRSSRGSALFHLRIVNLGQLTVAFGEDAARAMLAAVLDRTSAILGDRGTASVRGDGLDVVLGDIGPMSGNGVIGAGRGAMERRFIALGSVPVPYAGISLHAVTSCAGGDLSPVTIEAGSRQISVAFDKLDAQLLDRDPQLAAPGSALRWATSYARDMRSAALTFAAMAEDRLFLTWQPILGGADGRRVLYSEGLARIADPDRRFGAEAAVVRPDAFIPALERLGLVRAFDAHIVGLTIKKLRANPAAQLGCNISAHSAVLDGWWTGLLADLDGDPRLAERLTFEITETARAPSISLTLEFVRALRSRGCRLAVDDFGVGQMSIGDAVQLVPDVIKIDASFLRQASGCDGLAQLACLIDLAAVIGRAVVVEGISSKTDEDLATTAGATWMQGYFLATPAIKLLPDNLVVADQTAVVDQRNVMQTPGIVIPGRHWILIFVLAIALWGMIVVAFRMLFPG